MKKFRWIMVTIATLLIIAQLLLFDYGDWSWSHNWGGLAIIVAMSLTIISLIWPKRHEKEQQPEEDRPNR